MRTSDSRRTKLALATFAGALGLLVANDWLFKGQGILPSWLTGKLSDFAGLIVAPVALTSLVAARRRSAQLCCIAAVAAVFTLTEISPAGAAMIEELLARVGLPWRLWPDLGDLAASSVLPITWLCCRALSGNSGAESPSGRFTRWLAVPAGVACLASGGGGTFSAMAYVYNESRATAFVEVSGASLDCADLSAFDRTFLDPDDFVSLGVFELAAGTVLPLTTWMLDDDNWRGPQTDCRCPLFRVSAAGQTVHVTFQDLPWLDFVQKPRASGLKRFRPQLVVVHAEPEPIEVGTQLRTFELALPGARQNDASCAPLQRALDVGFPPARHIEQISGDYSAASLSGVPILATTPIAGNCFELELGAPGSASEPPPIDAGSDASGSILVPTADAGSNASGSVPPDREVDARIQICAPLDLFPFQAGDRVRFEWSESTDWGSSEPVLETVEIRDGNSIFRLMRGMYGSAQYGSWQDYEANFPAARCGPLRNADGSLFEPIEVTYAGQALVPGQAVRIGATTHQIYLGRAQRLLGRACGTEQSWIEVMEIWTD